MADFDLVDVFNTRNNLLEEAASFIFLQALSLDNIVKTFTTTSILHDEEELARGFNNLKRKVNCNNQYLPHKAKSRLDA